MSKEITRTASQVLDGVRGIAALAVFVGHLRNLFLVDFGQMSVTPSLFVRGLYFLTGFGHAAVIVFFVLSGFFIASSVIRSTTASAGWSWRLFGLQRLTRLYVVLIPALLLGAAWDTAGIHLAEGTGVYARGSHGEYKAMLAASVPEATTIYNWLGSLFFLQGIACAPFGSNGPLWSLSYEFWYYLLFPLLYLAVTTVGTPRSIKVKAAMAVIGVSIVTFIGPEMRLYFCIWLLGAAVAMLDPIPLARTRRALWVSVLAFAAALVWNRLAKGNMEGQFIRDAILGATCAFSLYVLLCQQRGHRINEGSRLAFLARFTGNVSFSLYLLHLPFLVFVNGQVIGSGGRWIPDGVHVAALFGIACLSFAYVILIWRFTEAKTEIVRRYAVRAFLPPYISQKKNPS